MTAALTRLLRRAPKSRRGRIETSIQRVRLEGHSLDITVRRNPRARRLILRITPDSGTVVLTVPPGVSVADALAFARGKGDWICGRLDALPRRVAFAEGSVVPILGGEYRIRCDGAGRTIRVDGSDIVVSGEPDDVSGRLHAWLRRRARAEIVPRVALAAARVGRPAGRITIRDTRSRWGSCAVNGNLSFSWRLVMAPAFVLDYVVAHEVAHLSERGHGPAFWRLTGTLTPQVPEARRWLRDNGAALMLYG